MTLSIRNLEGDALARHLAEIDQTGITEAVVVDQGNRTRPHGPRRGRATLTTESHWRNPVRDAKPA